MLIIQTVAFSGQIIATDVLVTIQTLINIVASIWSATVFVTTVIIRTVLEIGSAIGMWLFSVVIAITKAIGGAIQAIAHIIEIPFKVLASFWEQIKPYVMILGKHIKMSGDDLANGFASWEKVASLVTSPK